MMLSTRRVVVSIMAAAAVMAVGSVEAASHSTPETLAPVVAAAPDSLDLDGHVVYLDFWASWCTPCRASFPWMARLQAKYHDRGLEVVTVNLDRDSKAARKFLEKMKSPLRVISDPKGKLAEQYDVEVMPSSFVCGRDGTIRSRHEGFQVEDCSSLESMIVSLLEEKAPK